jgi:hypothetical protein
MTPHFKWGSCHQGMVRPQVAEGEDGLQIWCLNLNILNKQSQTAKNVWSSIFGVGRRADNSP